MQITQPGFYKCKLFSLKSVMFPSLYENIDISYDTYFINPNDAEEIFIMDDNFENLYVAKWNKYYSGYILTKFWFYENFCGLKLHKEWIDIYYEGIYDPEIIQIIKHDLSKYNDKNNLSLEISSYPIEYNWY